MGSRKIELTIHTGYSKEDLERKIRKIVKTGDFTYRIDRKSLDARKKNAIKWVMSVAVSAPGFREELISALELVIPFRKRKEKVTIVGSGPAGFFCAYVLQKSGFSTVILERGGRVDKRQKDIEEFESTCRFNPVNNYAFGEGGAGTFSDGKLTSRTKHISKEKHFILNTYVSAGAPEEILYMAHPHLGSDNLITIVKNLRTMYEKDGGTILFNEKVDDISVTGNSVVSLTTDKNEYPSEIIVFATGHSAYDTYRMLMKRGVAFRTKNFAIGSRVEHPQILINKAQWGTETLPGIKAAEYRLTFNDKKNLPVYTFCMCPGGKIVPTGAFKDTNIVNGMSLYKRNGTFANAAVVAAVNLNTLLKREVSPEEAMKWVENLEKSFYSFSGGFSAPFCSIQNFMDRKGSVPAPETSYPMGLKEASLWDMFPAEISTSISGALNDFSRKIKGYETGIIMGLESKTSSPIQAVRDRERKLEGFNNLYMIGEGSGYSGGIISSAVEGVKTALRIAGDII